MLNLLNLLSFFLNISSLNILSSLSSNIFFSFWVVNNLSLNWEILNSFPCFFDGLIFNNSFFNFFWDIFNLSFNSIIICDGSFNWNSLIMNNFIIFYNLSLIRNSFNSFYLIIFNIFFFERNIFNSAFNWNLLCYNFLSKVICNYLCS